MSRIFHTGQNKEIAFEKIPDTLLDYYNKNKHYEMPFQLVIGTDSQNYADRRHETKICTAICYLCKTKGGIFFYANEYVPLITNIRQKLHLETAKSLETADDLLELLVNDEKFEDMYLNSRFSLNIDAGYEDSEFRNPQTHSGTESFIPELVAWVNAMGYEATVKPEDRSAASVADKLSK